MCQPGSETRCSVQKEKLQFTLVHLCGPPNYERHMNHLQSQGLGGELPSEQLNGIETIVLLGGG